MKLGAKPDAGSGPFTPKAPFWERPGFTIWTAAAVDPAAEEKRFVEAFPDVYAVSEGCDTQIYTHTHTTLISNCSRLQLGFVDILTCVVSAHFCLCVSWPCAHLSLQGVKKDFDISRRSVTRTGEDSFNTCLSHTHNPPYMYFVCGAAVAYLVWAAGATWLVRHDKCVCMCVRVCVMQTTRLTSVTCTTSCAAWELSLTTRPTYTGKDWRSKHL